MTPTAETVDFPSVFSSEDSGPQTFLELRKEIHCSIDLRGQLEGMLSDFPTVAKGITSENRAETRRGIASWVLGRVEAAVEVLEPTRQSKERAFFLGTSYLELGRFTEALEELKAALDADSSFAEAKLAYLETRIKAGQFEQAEKMLDQMAKKFAESADYHYLHGLLYDVQGFATKAMNCYEKAVEVEPGHARSLFRMAHTLDLRGEDAQAMELYEQLRKMRPMHVNTVMNLGTIYEDRGEFDRAAECYQIVLDYFPTHRRARLYLRDAVAASSMFYDEDAARREAKMQQVLQQPVSEVSCSPRARTAMTKLGITTMGELAALSEDDFLAVPNFGRTSLREIKEILSARGLSLSSGDQPAAAGAISSGGSTGGDGGDAHSKKLVEMEWSGRIQKVFEMMNFQTVGDLLSITEADLMKHRNFGMTSIKEIRNKLSQIGVSMREE